jgi:leader peptidase (prepilin peptidase)/N-methyltransferase
MLNIIIIIITGLVVGSFLNVVIFRMKELHTVINTRSRCPECKTEIKWYDLIPFLSFVLLRTKCRNCGKQISWQYPIVEIGTAILFLFLYSEFGFSYQLIMQLILAFFAIAIFVYDLKNLEIPDEMLYPAIVIAVLNLAFFHPSSFLNGIYGILICAGFLGLLYLLGIGKWLGFGDVKLGILLGLMSPFPFAILTLFLAFAIGSIVGIYMILIGQKTFKSEVPFAPFLIISLYLSIFYGDKIINWYLGLI